MDTHTPEEYQIECINIYASDVRINDLIYQSYYNTLEKEAYAYIDSSRNSRKND
jgi:hypothetical protein